MSRADELLNIAHTRVSFRADRIIRDLEFDLGRKEEIIRDLESDLALLRRARDEAFDHADTAWEERDSAIARAEKAELHAAAIVRPPEHPMWHEAVARRDAQISLLESQIEALKIRESLGVPVKSAEAARDVALHERDAAIARAEKAERERDEERKRYCLNQLPLNTVVDLEWVRAIADKEWGTGIGAHLFPEESTE